MDLIEPRQENIEYYTDHRDGVWYIRVNDHRQNLPHRHCPRRLSGPRILARDRRPPGRRDARRSGALSSFRRARRARPTACRRCASFSFDKSGWFAPSSRQIAFPEPTYSAHPHVNRELCNQKFRYGYQSLSVAYVGLPGRREKPVESTLIQELEIPGGFDRSLYRSERLFAKAPDGTAIPVSHRLPQRQEGVTAQTLSTFMAMALTAMPYP